MNVHCMGVHASLATLTFIHFMLLRLHILLSSFWSPPNSKRRLPCMTDCDCVKDVAAWAHLLSGLFGPLEASLCQCCMINNSPCYYCNYNVRHSRTRKHVLNTLTIIIMPKQLITLTFSTISKVTLISTSCQWLYQCFSVFLLHRYISSSVGLVNGSASVALLRSEIRQCSMATQNA